MEVWINCRLESSPDVPWIASSTFYGWYQRYLDGGPEALEDRKPRPRGRWNRISQEIRQQVVDLALERTELSARELACHFPWEAETAIRDFFAYYNTERYHESLDNVTPSDVYHGPHHKVLSERKRIKQLTRQRRKREYLAIRAASVQTMNRLLATDTQCPEYSDGLQYQLSNKGLIQSTSARRSCGKIQRSRLFDDPAMTSVHEVRQLWRHPRALSLAAALLGMPILVAPLGAQNLGIEAAGVPGVTLGGACADGVVLDDGTPESGYGWIPSVVDGRYVQTFQTNAFNSRRLLTVCVCWTRTREDSDIDFRIEVYGDTGKGPEMDPVASIPASMADVPEFPEAGFVEVTVSGQVPRLPAPIVHIGVAWNPSVDEFFFVCADQSPATPQVNGYFIDDRADEWASVLDANDPIFQDHRSMLIRARAALQGVGPVLGGRGIWILLILLAAIGWHLVRK